MLIARLFSAVASKRLGKRINGYNTSIFHNFLEKGVNFDMVGRDSRLTYVGEVWATWTLSNTDKVHMI